MRMPLTRSPIEGWLLATLVLCWASPAAAQEQRFASLGDVRLESGEILRDCRIGYRTVGTLAPDKSNVVLMPTWASGTSEQIVSGQLGPGRLVDTTKYHVVVVDALANGVSSSPSTSQQQPRMQFPRITIGDMVETQHTLLTRVLGFERIHAIVGTSMGGMQAFQWIVAYPTFVNAAVPIVGSPRLAPYDLLHWKTQIDAITNDPAWNGGNYTENPARVAGAEFGALLLTSPAHYNRTTTRAQVFEELERAKAAPGFDANDKIRQTQAMMALDVADAFGGSLEKAAASVKARVLVVVATADHVVTPEPALAFAKLLGADVVTLESDCGHLAPGCEPTRVNEAVAAFLAR
jgi:homoserine O-acetyltransferase